MPIHSCNYCNYKTDRMYNLKVHQRNKHGNHKNESELKTYYMQDYPQEQPVYHGQVAKQQPVYNEQVDHQEPVYYDKVDHPSHTQINPQTNVMVVRNRYIQNKVNELQGLLRNQNVQAEQTIPF